MKISDVLWKAANELLGEDHRWEYPRVEESCVAVVAAQGELDDCRSWRTNVSRSPAAIFLKQLGCPVGDLKAFDEFPRGGDRQGARYAWLMFAYERAKEQGL